MDNVPCFSPSSCLAGGLVARSVCARIALGRLDGGDDGGDAVSTSGGEPPINTCGSTLFVGVFELFSEDFMAFALISEDPHALFFIGRCSARR